MTFRHKTDLLGVFAHHPVACNLLMIMMILSGVWGLDRLTTQFFPTFALDFVTVRVTWTGAAAEDVETSVTNPLEQELRTLDGLREMTSTSSEGVASIVVEYEEGTDMGVALDQVKERVALIRNLPAGAEEPEVSRVVRYEPIARLLVSGADDPRDLRPIVRQMERELLERGIEKISIDGLPEEEIAIQVSSIALRELDMSIEDVAERIARRSRDLPAGTVGRSDTSRQLRALEQRRTEVGFERLPLVSDESGRLLTLGDVATVERRARDRQIHVQHRGGPAVAMLLSRAETSDSLEAARILERWLEDSADRRPPGIRVEAYDESWRLIRERVMLLVKNGASGLALVVAILFVFLNGRVAAWVAAGIPVSFMATLGILYLVGGSINMISLFALIMALGIIVDDAIVVGEDALAHYQAGESPLEAAEGGARRMLAPVLSSSLTTVAAFLPLMLVSGIIGNILFDIPLVVVCVILASLVESFLVLPGHLRHAFTRIHTASPSRRRAWLDDTFATFRDGVFTRLVTRAIAAPWTTVSAAVALLMLATGLVAGPPARVRRFLQHVETQLESTQRHFDAPLVEVTAVYQGRIQRPDGQRGPRGDQFGTVVVELVEPDRRSVRNPDFIQAWRQRVELPPGIESFAISERRGGPPGRDIDVRLVGLDARALKAAALELAEILSTVPGVGDVQDDMPFGQEQLIYRLSAEARALGLTVEAVGQQLRAAYDGRIAQIFQEGDDEVEVRVVLPDQERHHLASLDRLAITLPAGGSVPLRTAVDIETRRGFDILRHKDGRLSIRISADVDPAVNNSNDVIAELEASALPDIKLRFGIDHVFEGRRADQEETLADMARGGLLALAMIYLVLSWVFASYGWPLVVMAAIPFGLVGALTGHWLLGIDLTVLSLFGFFGLSGIVVNDSIILVMFYKQISGSGIRGRAAIVEAARLRLRAVLLTSLTTIAGLTPLMFETSLQAQFLIPMAASISFGLAFATGLVLLVIPALLCLHEQAAGRLSAQAGPPDSVAAALR
jgi:multidrug efflux pump subunit AcrB